MKCSEFKPNTCRQPTAFCLSSGKTHISPCGLYSLRRCGIGLVAGELQSLEY